MSETKLNTPSGSVIPLGTIVKPYGEVSGVTNRGGERYYFLAGGIGVSLMPADLIEKMHSQNKANHAIPAPTYQIQDQP